MANRHYWTTSLFTSFGPLVSIEHFAWELSHQYKHKLFMLHLTAGLLQIQLTSSENSVCTLLPCWLPQLVGCYGVMGSKWGLTYDQFINIWRRCKHDPQGKGIWNIISAKSLCHKLSARHFSFFVLTWEHWGPRVESALLCLCQYWFTSNKTIIDEGFFRETFVSKLQIVPLSNFPIGGIAS